MMIWWKLHVAHIQHALHGSHTQIMFFIFFLFFSARSFFVLFLLWIYIFFAVFILYNKTNNYCAKWVFWWHYWLTNGLTVVVCSSSSSDINFISNLWRTVASATRNKWFFVVPCSLHFGWLSQLSAFNWRDHELYSHSEFIFCLLYVSLGLHATIIYVVVLFWLVTSWQVWHALRNVFDVDLSGTCDVGHKRYFLAPFTPWMLHQPTDFYRLNFQQKSLHIRFASSSKESINNHN